MLLWNCPNSITGFCSLCARQKLSNPTALSPNASSIDGNKTFLPDVLRLFTDWQDKITNALPSSVQLKAEEKAVIDFPQNCFGLCIPPIHAAAFMLDPTCTGKAGSLSTERGISAYCKRTAMVHHLHTTKGKVVGSLAKSTIKDAVGDACNHNNVGQSHRCCSWR